jgi:hypothetical protein
MISPVRAFAPLLTRRRFAMDAGKSIVSSRAFSSLPAAGKASLPFIGFPSRILHLFRGGSPETGSVQPAPGGKHLLNVSYSG